MTARKTLLGDILAPSGQRRAGKNDYPVLSITMKQGLVDQADKFKKRVASQNTSNYRVACRDELVVGFPIDEGVLGFQTRYPAAIVSPAYDIWRLKNGADCHIPYLERYLRSTQARHMYASRMQGAVARRRSLTKADFLLLEIYLPPLDDQIRIAHLLGKVEGLIAQRKQQLQQLDDLLKSVFLEMFGDPVRNEKGWETFSFSQLFALPPKIGTTKPASDDGEIPVVRVGEIGRLHLNVEKCAKVSLTEGEYEKCKVEIDDILLARAIGSREQLGKASLITESMGRLAFDSHVMRIRFDPKRVHPLFAYSWLMSSGGRRLFLKSSGQTSVQFNINAKQISSIDMPLPDIEQQENFAEAARCVEIVKSQYQQSLAGLETLYGALSQKAFNGELDLSRVSLPDAEPQLPQTAMPAIGPSLADVPNAIDLPDTELLLAALGDHSRLKELLFFWLEAYRAQLNGASFSTQAFLTAAQTRIAELHPDKDFELGVDAYELVKTWVFDGIKSRELKQTRDIVSIGGKRKFGNEVLLRVRASGLS